MFHDSTVTVHRLRVENHHSGFGIGHSRPRISWSYVGNIPDWEQTAYQIKLLRKDRQESSEGHGQRCAYIDWPFSPLVSGESSTLQVRASGLDDRWTEWSSLPIETSLLERSQWKAQMITRPNPPPDEYDAPKQPIRLWTSFNLCNLGEARLYCTAYGMYEVEVNGIPVSDEVLHPGWQAYQHHLKFQTFDITKLLAQGENRIGVYVGPGWYCGRLGGSGGKRNLWGDAMGFFGQIHVNGEIVCVTDHNWKWTLGPLLESEIFDGEIFDSQKNDPDWLASEHSSQMVAILAQPSMELICSDQPPVRRIDLIKAKDIIVTPSGKRILDFGENFVGWLKCQRDIKGTGEVLLRHAEVLEDGELGTRPLSGAKARDILMLGGPTKGWEPRFTWHGFRYAEVNGVDELAIDDFVGVFISSDMLRIGHFDCSHRHVNLLHESVIRSLKGNFISIPTDCPQRDERQGWTGDIQVFSQTASYLYDTTSFLSSWLSDLAAEQKEQGGVVPQIVPWLKQLKISPQRGIWGDAAIITPWEVYKASGDARVLRAQWDSMVSWLDEGVLRGSDGLWDPLSVQYGDWLDPKAPPQYPAHGRTDTHLACNAFLVYVTGLVASIGHILGDERTAFRFSKDYERLATLYEENYVTRGGRLASDSQTAFTLTLRFGLVDEGVMTDRRRKMIDRFVYLVRWEYFKIGTGFAGTPLILDTLAENGQVQLAYRMLQEKDCPGWLYPIQMGATTTWERWDSMLPDGKINPGRMTSFNHYALGSVASFLHKVVGGLSCAKPGWQKALIHPRPGGTIRAAKTSIESPVGRYAVEWKIENGTLQVISDIPPNGRATICVEKEEREVGSGKHTVQVPWTDDLDWPPKGIPGPQGTKIPDEYLA